MTDKITFTLDGREVEAEPGETVWQVAQRHGTEIPHLCWHPAPGYRADGNCRACMVEVEGERVLAASCQRKAAAGMKVKTASERAKKSPPDGVRAAAGRPARARDEPRSQGELLDVDRRHGRLHAPAPAQGRAARARRHAFGHRRQPRRLHQLRPVRARLPRGADERRHRHGLSRTRRQGRVRLRLWHGPFHLRGVRGMRAGVPDRRADGGQPARQGGKARQFRDAVGRHALPLLRGRLPDHGPRQGREDPLCRRPRRARQREPPVRQGPLRLRLHPSPGPADQAAGPPRRRRQGRQHADPARRDRQILPRSDLGGGAGQGRCRLEAHP